MLFNVPQYIDVEDKVAGPLTVKQLLWMIGMVAVLMILWNIYDPLAFFIAAVPVVCIFVALAFYRPYNQPLIVFIGNAILFIVRPKVYVWDRPTKVISAKKVKETPEAHIVSVQKVVTADEVSRLAKIVDNQK
ncbi:MAG: PrgI family protein [Candidatus Moranbacteria bacterium]|nr:PrgI family protein [Candidatus Moranbacteria bacterium]